MKKLATLLSLLIVIFTQAYSQMGITCYSFAAIAINTKQSNFINAELKAFANRDFNDLLLEIDGFYNFTPTSYHQFRLGVGLNTDLFGPDGGSIYSLNIPGQLEIFPLQQFKQLSLMFELSPEFVFQENVRLRTMWGLRYTLGGGSKTDSEPKVEQPEAQ